MSQHHQRQKWSTDSPKFRKQIERSLPARCVNVPCICGGVVHPEQKWSVGHKPGHEAHRGQRATIDDVGPAHVACQRREGGTLGAAKTNRRRATQRAAAKGLRPWL